MKELVESKFNGIPVNFYKEKDEICMTAKQLGRALGYEDFRSFQHLMEQNPELLNREFSFLTTINHQENGIWKRREMRFFNEDGIYEACMLAKTSKGKIFRKWVREMIKKLRTGDIKLIQPMEYAEIREQIDKKLDKMEQIFDERRELLEKMDGDGERIIDLIEVLNLKIEEVDQAMAIVRDVRKRIGVLELKMDDLYCVLTEQHTEEF